jgi:hypothetical protein
MPQSRYTTWVIIIAALLFIGSAAAAWPFTVDDSFITFRYAANLSAGYGPVYNPGAAPAEGYTAFLWVLVMTLPHLPGIDAVVFSKIVGILAIIGCGAVTYQYVTFLLGERRWLPAALAALFTDLCRAAVERGMKHVTTRQFADQYFLWILTNHDPSLEACLAD